MLKLSLSFIWKWKWQIAVVILATWLFLSFSFPSPFTSLESGRSSIAIQERIVERVKTEFVDRPVIKLVPTPAEVKKIENKLGTQLPEGEILNIVKAPSLSNGGTIIPFLDKSGLTQVKIIENKPKFFSLFKHPFIEYEYDQLNKEHDLGLGFDGIKAGRCTLGIKGGAQVGVDSGSQRAYLKGRIRIDL